MRTLLFLTLCVLGCAGWSRSRRANGTHVQPGNFDYYILSLSWAPDFCDRPNVPHDTQECGTGRKVGFVVHGLWPQLDDGGHPSQCAPARPVAQDIVQRMLALIPSEGLIQHEWRDHGTCSGLSPAAYFDTIRNAYDAVAIPADWKQLNQRLDLSPKDIEAKFASVNPRFRNSLRVACSGGELAEIRVCMGKDLSPRACGSHDAECPAARITMLPVR